MSDDDLLIYPTEKVVGIAADREALAKVHRTLDEAGISAEQVEVLSGDVSAERLDPDAHGPFAKAMRTVQKALGDEAVRLEGLNDALEAGHYVVQVDLTESDDAAREAEKQAIGRALKDAGAESVAFYGRYQIEELTLGA